MARRRGVAMRPRSRYIPMGCIGGLSVGATIRSHAVPRRGTVAISLKLLAPPTDEEILEMSERNPGFQFERSIEGELLVTPAGSKSGRRELVLGAQLDAWAESDGSGLAFGPSAGFRLADGSLLSPDASWVRRDRWEAFSLDEQEDFAPICPDA